MMKDPLPVVRAFDDVRMALTMNRTVQHLNASDKTYTTVMNHIGDGLGLTSLAPMTNASVDSMISVVMYAGDGVV